MQNYDVQLEEIKHMQKLCSGFVHVDEKNQSQYLVEVGKVLEGEL
jgi:hypothetical protein